MGRAERRRKERRDRIEDRKGKILVSPAELSKIKNDIAYQASGYHTEYLMTCFALAMHRHGIEADTIGDCLSYIDGLMNDLLTEEATMDDYIKILEDETGIIVKCKED